MNIEEKIRNENRIFTWRVILVVGFILTMAAGFILGCFLLFLRPEISDLEKRELTKFPEFTKESFLDGSYTSEISTWFADTFPFREKMLMTQKKIEEHYGFRTDMVNAVADGDDIPDIDDLIESIENSEKTTESTAEPSPETEIPETEPSESESETSTESVSEKEYENVDGKELQNLNPFEAGDVNVKDNVGYCVYGFNQKAADIYAENVARIKTLLPEVSVYDILVPDNSAIMLDEETKTAWKLSDERRVIQYYQAKMHSLNTGIIDVDIYDTLMEHNDEYLYFYTDHHWTQLGAYYTYVNLCKKKGIAYNELSEYEQVVTENFLGSYYSTNGYAVLESNPDTIYAFIPKTTNSIRFYDDTMQAFREGKIIRDMNEFKPVQKYMGFIYGDNSISYIESGVVKNGEVCMVIKESFGNTFVPFLADHYEKVIVIDYRAYKDSVVQLAKDENVTDIIFINNLEAISDVYTMETQMGGICK